MAITAVRVIATFILGLVGVGVFDSRTDTPAEVIGSVGSLPIRTGPETTDPPQPQIVFRHGDISWLPQLARQAGWPEETWPVLGHIILRESGGCPNRQGGDRVDANCNVTGIFSRKNRSDTGLLQINGLNYDISRNRWALLCNEMGICEQALLFDPLTNLRAGYALYQHSGWRPWDPCQWGAEYAKQCKSTQPLPTIP